MKSTALVTWLVLALVPVAGVAMLLGWLPTLPCPFHQWLHIACPMCGSTRAWLALLSGDVRMAFAWNPLFWFWGGLVAFAYVDGIYSACGKRFLGRDLIFTAWGYLPARVLILTIWAGTFAYNNYNPLQRCG